ncbi:hypothetical protein CSUB01_10309 [Colletotrichum sublineola]|uniref:Uncharacterized protein n=1 Tax=Colletotrichum sublineola TaxID=1173701 RepID=A0A066WST9_COLSU|nr:hypothetical protein CSUB01_10309 [Colletotrichum sublineola]
MVATDHGISAQAPYLKKLVYGYNHCRGRTRQIHLIWQVTDLGIVHAAESILNPILNDDTLDDGYPRTDPRDFYLLRHARTRNVRRGSQSLIPGCTSDEVVTKSTSTHSLGASDVERLVTKHLYGGTGRSHGKPARVRDFGTRARLYVGSPDLAAGLWGEASRILDRTVQGAVGQMGDMLILVSAANETRDALCDLAKGFLIREDHPLYDEYRRGQAIRAYLENNVWLRELDYQPVD